MEGNEEHSLNDQEKSLMRSCFERKLSACSAAPSGQDGSMIQPTKRRASIKALRSSPFNRLMLITTLSRIRHCCSSFSHHRLGVPKPFLNWPLRFFSGREGLVKIGAFDFGVERPEYRGSSEAQ